MRKKMKRKSKTQLQRKRSKKVLKYQKESDTEDSEIAHLKL
jgi:hypothetical protein